MKFLQNTLAIMLVFMLFSASSIAQEKTVVLRTNLPSYGFVAPNITGEFVLSPALSVDLGVHFKTKSNITVDGEVTSSDGSNFSGTEEVSIGGIVLTPSLRWYTTKNAPHGFYLSPFMRYFNYKIGADYDYTREISGAPDQIVPVEGSGNVKGIGGGLTLGGQFLLGGNDSFVLDINFGFGGASTNMNMLVEDKDLLPSEYADIKQGIEDEKDANADVFLLGNLLGKVEANATDSSAEATINGVFMPIVRFGVSIGWAF